MILTSLASYFVNGWVSSALYGDQEGLQPRAAAHEPGLDHVARLDRRHVRRDVPAPRLPPAVPARPLVGARDHHLVRHDRRRAHPRIHQDLHLHGEPPREGDRHVLEAGRRLAQHPLGLRGRQLLRVLDGARDHPPHVRGLLLLRTAPRSRRSCPPSSVFAAPIFAFGLVAFGFLGMGPVTIAVDSFGPVTDNAQSVYELSQIESKDRTSRRRSSATSASSRTSHRPSTSSRRATAPATPSRRRPSPSSSARRSWARPRWSSASSCS